MFFLKFTFCGAPLAFELTMLRKCLDSITSTWTYSATWTVLVWDCYGLLKIGGISCSSLMVGLGVRGSGMAFASSETLSTAVLKVDAKNSSLDRLISFWKDFSSGEMEGLVEPSKGPPSSKKNSEVG